MNRVGYYDNYPDMDKVFADLCKSERADKADVFKEEIG